MYSYPMITLPGTRLSRSPGPVCHTSRDPFVTLPGDPFVGPRRDAGSMTRTAELDEDALTQRLGRQRLVISRDQATACGMTPGALRHRIRAGGPWQRLLPGVYLAATGTPTLIQNEIAALLYAGPGSVITGLAALRRHGLRVPEGSGPAVLIPGGRARASWGSVAVWPTTRMPERVCFEGAVQFALVPRAVADAARELASFRDTGRWSPTPCSRAGAASTGSARNCAAARSAGRPGCGAP